MKKPNEFKTFDVADSMAAAASALDVPLEVVKRMKRSGSVAFKGSRVHLRELARAILSGQEPNTILFPVPTGPESKPKIVAEFRELLRAAMRCRWLSASEILEILLKQIIEAVGNEKLPTDDADKLASAIHIGFGTAVMILEPTGVDQFLGGSATLLEAFAESPTKTKMQKKKNQKMRTKTNFRVLIRDAATFAEKLDILTEAGMSHGRAIMFARKFDGEGYNGWMRKRWSGGDVQISRGSIMQRFRIIGG
jgi:hypothetical protein